MGNQLGTPETAGTRDHHKPEKGCGDVKHPLQHPTYRRAVAEPLCFIWNICSSKVGIKYSVANTNKGWFG